MDGIIPEKKSFLENGWTNDKYVWIICKKMKILTKLEIFREDVQKKWAKRKNYVFIHATSELYIFVVILEHDIFDVEKWYQGLLEYAFYCLRLWWGCGCNPVRTTWGTLLFYCPALAIRELYKSKLLFLLGESFFNLASPFCGFVTSLSFVR